MKTKLYFLLCIICCACVVVYLYRFAEDRFQSISQFSITVEDQSSAEVSAGLLSVLSGSGNVAGPDLQAAIAFIHSADLLSKLEEEFNLAEHYKQPEHDIIFKLEDDASLEDRLKYYRERIVAKYNQVSGMIDLSVETFDPGLSHRLSKQILSDTEQFINSLNKDVANERLNSVNVELERAQNVVEQSEQDILSFQTKHKIINPETIIAARIEAIQALRLEKDNKEVNLRVLKSTSSNSPLIRELIATIKETEAAIQSREEVLTGPEQVKFNTILAGFKSLQLKQDFALKLREGAQLILEQTRAQAITKSRFFSVIQNPYLAEEYTNPRREYLSATWVTVIILSFYLFRAFCLSIFDRV